MNEESLQARSTKLRQKWWFDNFMPFMIVFLLVGGGYAVLIYQSDTNARITTRSGWSRNNLKKIGLASLNYASQNDDMLPPGATVDAKSKPLHSWMTILLPNMDQPGVARRIKYDIPWNAPANFLPFSTEVPSYLNPDLETITSDGYAMGHYSANKNLFFDNSHFTVTKIARADGVSNTILAGEIKENLPAWGDPSNQRDLTLGINKKTNGFGSPYPGGAHMVFADGRVKFISEDIAPEILKALSTPNGGEDMTGMEY